MNKIKCVIVDDEELARQLLAEYLQDYDHIDIVAECASGRQAIEKIDALELLKLSKKTPSTTC